MTSNENTRSSDSEVKRVCGLHPLAKGNKIISDFKLRQDSNIFYLEGHRAESNKDTMNDPLQITHPGKVAVSRLQNTSNQSTPFSSESVCVTTVTVCVYDSLTFTTSQHCISLTPQPHVCQRLLLWWWQLTTIRPDLHIWSLAERRGITVS